MNLPPNIREPLLDRGLQPSYPPLIQVCRVTAATVPGPLSGSSSSSPTGNVYVAFTEQVDPATLLPRDREPCLVVDVNRNNLAAGYYVCRLVGNYGGLPLYTAQSASTGGSTSLPGGAITVTTGGFVIPQVPTQSAGSSSASAGGTVTVTVGTTSSLVINELVEITDGVNLVYGTVTNILNSTQFVFKPLEIFAGSPGNTMAPGAFVVICFPIYLNMPVVNARNLNNNNNPIGQIYIDPFGNLAQKPILSSLTTQAMTVPTLQLSTTVYTDTTDWMTTGMQVAIQQGRTYLHGIASNITPNNFTFTLTSAVGGGPGGNVGINASVIPVSSPNVVPTTSAFTIPNIGTGVTVNVPSTITPLANNQMVSVSDGTNTVYGYLTNQTATSFTLTPTAIPSGSPGNTMRPSASITPFGTTTNPLMGLPSRLTNSTTGYPYIPTTTGRPTGTPNSFSGFMPLVFDTTDGVLWLYNPDKLNWFLPADLTLVTASSPYTARYNELVLTDVSGGDVPITLPNAVLNATVAVQRVGSGSAALTVSPASGTVNGASSWSTNVLYEIAKFICDGVNWYTKPDDSGDYLSADLTGQTTDVSSVISVTAPNDGNAHQYEFSGYLNITAVSGKTVQMQIVYTDESSTGQFYNLLPTRDPATGLLPTTTVLGGGTYNYSFAAFTIRVKANTTPKIQTSVSLAGTSINYDVGANIQRIN